MNSPRIRIPDPDLPGLEAFLEAHPEQRARIEAQLHRDRELRAFAEVVVAEIYNHYASGSPSRWGLCVTLRSLLRLLEEENAEIRRDQASDLAALVGEIGEVRSRLAEDPRRQDPKEHARRLLAITDALIDELDDARDKLTGAERIGRQRAQRARAEALREAAGLVRRGIGAEELDRRATDAESAIGTLDEVAAELGIELDLPDAPEATD